MACRICEREMLPDGDEQEWRCGSKIDPELCMGCWFAWIELEKFLIRSGRRPKLTLVTQDSLKELLKKFELEEH